MIWQKHILNRILFYGPSLLLVAIAFSQIYLAKVEGHLAPDKGGGYGLFSTVDRLTLRTSHFYGISLEGAEESLGFNSQKGYFRSLKPLVEEARSLPTEAKMQRVLKVLKMVPEFKKYRKLRMEVHKCQYESKNSLVRFVKVAESRWE